MNYDGLMRITDAQWNVIEPIIAHSTSLRVKPEIGGRPRVDDRQVINGIIWVLLNGTQWSELPPTMGSHITCWRRYTEWVKKGTWDKIWVALFKTMERKQLLEWSMALWQGCFVPIKKNS